MSENLSLAFLADIFLVICIKKPQELSAPIEIEINGNRLERPYLALPFERLKDCAIVVRFTPSLADKAFSLRVIDASGNELVWRQNGFRHYRLVQRHLGIERIGLLCSKIYRHLESSFGRLTQAQFDHVSAVFAQLSGVKSFRINKNLIYFRFPCSMQSSRAMRRIEVTSINDSAGSTSASYWSLLSDGWLHCVIDPSDKELAHHEPWVIKITQNFWVPVLPSQAQTVRSKRADLTFALRDYPGEKTSVHDFIAGLAFTTEGVTEIKRQRPSPILGAICRVEGTQIIGWATDPQNPERSMKLQLLVDGQPLGNVKTDDWISVPGREGKVRGFRYRVNKALLDGSLHQFELRDTGLPDAYIGEPFLVGAGLFDGDFGISPYGLIAGHLSERCQACQPVELQLSIDDCVCETQTISQCQGSCEFAFTLPSVALDTAEHKVSIDLFRNGERIARLAEDIRHRSIYRGSVIQVRPGLITGWIINESLPSLPVRLELLINEEVVALAVADSSSRAVGNQPCGFEITFPPASPTESAQSLSLRIAGTNTEVLGPPRLVMTYQGAIRSLQQAAYLLKKNELSPGESEWARRQILAPAISSMRKAVGFPQQLECNLSPIARRLGKSCLGMPVDVIIPAYKGKSETLACIQSVIAGAGKTRFRVIVINDRSPDSELTAALQELAKNRRIHLIENERNLGFVASVNRGMRLSQDHDVVLLNSDTLVPPRWLDRLVKSAYQDAAIGTVTPFSNNATIASFPLTCRDNEMPEGYSVVELDREFYRSNGEKVVDLPTAIGFCMYIKRETLNDVGFFDEDQWGYGYAEENDFSLRASALGWRHILACGVFVQHHGSLSFGTEKMDLLKANLAKLNQLYPDYPALVHKFIQEDPPSAARNRVALSLLKQHSAWYMLFVTHRLGGGTQIAVNDLADRLLREGVNVLQMSAGRDGAMRLELHGQPYSLKYDRGQLVELIEDLRGLSIRHVHFHQTLFFTPEICRLAECLGTSYDVTCHDYQSICPRVNMIDETGWYCGDSQFDAKNCNRCVATSGLDSGVDRMFDDYAADTRVWRERYSDFLKRARRVFFPSRSARAIIERHVNPIMSTLRPHPESQFKIPVRKPEPDTEVLSVAVIGAIGSHKGYEILRACARNAAKDGLPLRFVVIGYTMDDASLSTAPNITITGEFPRENLGALVTQHRCRVAAFLSPWPETYSYVLSEAWCCGLFPVAFDLGAQAERIKAVGYGRVIPCLSDPKAINKALLESASSLSTPRKRITIAQDYDSVLESYYELPLSSLYRDTAD